MNWYNVKKRFTEKFPNYTISVYPRCISDSRYTHYAYEAMAVALGDKSAYNSNVVINHETKKVELYRDCSNMKTFSMKREG